MILSVRLNNYLFYSDGVELQLIPKKSIKRFEDNIYHEGNFKVLKSVCLYAPNNSGKTCFVRAIKYIQAVLLNETADLRYNTFYNPQINYRVDVFCNNQMKSTVSSFGVSFVYNGRAYSYDFKYDCSKKNGVARGFIYECMRELVADEKGVKPGEVIFLRDIDRKKYAFCGDPSSKLVISLKNELAGKSGDNIFVYSVNIDTYPVVLKYRDILRGFAESIDVVDSNNVSPDKTIQAMKNGGPTKDRIVELIRYADLDIEEYYYEEPVLFMAPAGGNAKSAGTQGIERKPLIGMEGLGLMSVHHGVKAPSVAFDSVGTCKVAALASYIVDALQSGKTLVVDELDSGLHFKLTRAIVLLFNNVANTKGQLIFNTHDITLLDCKKIFRQDQIWFTGKDKENGGEYFYSLADEGYTDKMIIDGEDISEKYRWGEVGILPEPDLLSVILPEKKTEAFNEQETDA